MVVIKGGFQEERGEEFCWLKKEEEEEVVKRKTVAGARVEGRRQVGK